MKKRIQLIVTGDCERLALHTSLAQLFPDATFLQPLKLMGFTSMPLEHPATRSVPTIDKFAMKLVRDAQVETDLLVVGVEDEELEGDAATKVAYLTSAVQRVIDGEPILSERNFLADLVRERCSFHLLVPMIESYFFGDHAALARAGALRPSSFDATTRDVETFEVKDESYISPEDESASDWCRVRPLRARHPKHYLEYLSGDGTPASSAYRETKHGKAALEKLDWPTVASNGNFVQSARALVADIADWLGCENPLPGVERPLTARASNRRQRVLRNV